MAFVSIGTLASDVLHKAKLAAAAQDTQRNEGGREPVAKGVSPSSLPIAQATAGGPKRAIGMGKDRSPKAPVSDARGNVRQTTASLEVLASVASLPVGRSIVMASKAVAPRKRQAPKVSAMIIDLTIYRKARAHAALAYSP